MSLEAVRVRFHALQQQLLRFDPDAEGSDEMAASLVGVFSAAVEQSQQLSITGEREAAVAELCQLVSQQQVRSGL